MFARIVLSAALGGLLAGLLWSGLQEVWTTPLILEAEIYENAAPSDPAAAAGHDPAEYEAWAPADGMERTLYTTLGTVVLAIGFGLLLVVGYALRGRVNWRQGLLWGLAGFITFSLAPAIGLPPELPGTEAAPLVARQAWWLVAVVLTGSGLAMIAFLPRAAWKAVGLAVLVLPHLFGAPHPEVAGGLAPAELEQAYIIASLATNGVAWVVLGGLTALFFTRLGRWVGGAIATAKST